MIKGWYMDKVSLTWIMVVCNLVIHTLMAQQEVQIVKVSQHVYEVLGGRGARGGAIVTDQGIALIDTKMDKASMDQALERIRAISDRPIRYLINTHSDADHTSGNRFMPAGVIVIAHQNCRKELFLPGRDGRPTLWSDPNMASFAPSITFSDRMDIYLGTTKVELWYLGVGHTTGDTVVYLPADRTAFIGDQVFVGRVPLIHAYKGGDSHQQVQTLQRMLAALPDAERFLSGHAEPIGRAGIEGYIEQMKARHAKVKMLQQQGQSLEQVKAAFPAEETSLVEIIWNECKKYYKQDTGP